MKKSCRYLEEINDAVELQSIRELMGSLTHGEGDFKKSWIEKNGWTVVPVESFYHFDGAQIERLLATVKVRVPCFAIAIEQLKDVPLAYKFEFSREALEEFNQATQLFFFVLFPEGMRWAILCTQNDYYLIGGDVVFVSEALGTDILEARAKFRSFAKTHTHPVLREALQELCDRYDTSR